MEDRGKSWETAVLTGRVTPLWAFTYTSLKRGIPAPQPLGASVRMCRHSGSACSWRQVSPSPPSITNRTCGPNNPWSPTARLPQRPWEAASTRAIAETGLILKYGEEAERQATSAFCSHPLRYQPREHIWILKPQPQVHFKFWGNTDRQFHYSSLWLGPLQKHLSVLLESHEMWEWLLQTWVDVTMTHRDCPFLPDIPFRKPQT